MADLDIQLSSELHALTEEAAGEFARFDAEVGHLAALFASILLRTESASSSEIENLTSGARQIALAELGEHASKKCSIDFSRADSLFNHLETNVVFGRY